MSRHAKLADHEHVHRSPKGPRDFESDRHTAPGKGQHHQVGSVGEMLQLTGEDSSGVSSSANRKNSVDCQGVVMVVQGASTVPGPAVSDGAWG